jgi:hypothetical protein
MTAMAAPTTRARVRLDMVVLLFGQLALCGRSAG